MNSKANKLINEKSPYLRQHAANPVDWRPWSEETFAYAKNEDKPVFLSIGYSTCHWCHVMEHESFEDEQTAALLNDTFVPVKVDREERPDIDHIYMTVCQMMTGRGGWPLTILMTPEKKPFFAATYIPRENRQGRLGLKELTKQVKELWLNRREEVERSSKDIIENLELIVQPEKNENLKEDVFDRAYNHFEDNYDDEYGGFGNAPKFPSPHNLMFLLRRWKKTGNKAALDMTADTLYKMRIGGIFDQLGLGFHRYSTDREWLLPHFEKMLYDQAMLAYAATETYQATGKNRFRQIAEEVLEYVLRDMTSPEGGFYSAEDADSEGEEGKFYVWTEDELKKLLDEDQFQFVKKASAIKPEGNFRDEASGGQSGKNILYLDKPIDELAEEEGIPREQAVRELKNLTGLLKKERDKRIHPLKDKKILTDWNGLMIAALAKTSSATGEEKFYEAAKKAAEFILGVMTGEGGKLYHRFIEGSRDFEGNLDDYAFMIWGLIELYEASFEVRWIKEAEKLCETVNAEFADETGGGYYFTRQNEDLPVRKKEIYDGAIPSGNSVMILNLIKLSGITGKTSYTEKAVKTADSVAKNINEMPSAYTFALCALDYLQGPSTELVIAGSYDDEFTNFMLREVYMEFIPNKVMLFADENDDSKNIAQIASYAKDYKSIEGKAAAYVCKNYQCSLPVTDINTLINMLNE